MKGTIVVCILFAATYAKPEGYYQQQYQYKSSSSSYKNNELQQKKDDEAFYSRHGDIEGKIEPKVNSYSQHSEYINPKSQVTNQGYNQALQNNDFYLQQTGAGNGGGFSSNCNTGSCYQTGKGTSYGSGSSSSSSSSSSNFQHGTTSENTAQQLASLQELRNNLARQLQQVMYEQQQKQSASGYSQSSTTNNANYGSTANYQYLENQLRNNITTQLNDAVRQQHQGHISNDNYNQYHKQLETDLIQQLQTGGSSHNVQSSHVTGSGSNTAYSTSYGTPGYTPVDSGTIHLTHGLNTNSHDSKSQYGSNSYNAHTYTVPKPIPLTDITSPLEIVIQNQINNAVYNKILKYTQNYAAQPQPDHYRDLQILTDELRRNVTKELDSALLRTYGRQEQRGSYYYTVTSVGPSATPNYRVDELQRLRQDLTEKLVRELQNKFQQQYAQYTQTYNQYTATSNRHSGQTNIDTGRNTYPYGTYPTTSPSNSQNSYGVKGHAQQTGYQYQYRPATTFVVTGNAPAELRRVTETIHFDVLRDIHTALAEQQRRYLQQHNSQSSHSSYNPPDYQVLLKELTNELQQNITRETQKQLAIQYGHQAQSGSNYYTVMSGGGYSSSPNYNSQQLNDITHQLQNDLLQQLQSGLSKQYSSHSSYSASSSYSGQASYGSNSQNPLSTRSYLRNGMQGDDNFHRFHSTPYPHYARHYNKYLDQDMTQQNVNVESSPMRTQHQPSHFTQQIQTPHSKNMHNQDLAQHAVDEFGPLEVGSQQKLRDYTQVQTPHRQNIYDQDLTQETEDDLGQLEIGAQQKAIDEQEQLEVGEHRQIPIPRNQKLYDQDLTQYTENEFGQLPIGGQQKIIESAQVQTPYNHKLHNQGLTQNTDDEFGQLQIGQQTREDFTQHEQKPHNQKIYEQDMTQQTDDEFEQLQIGGQQKIIEPIQVQTPYNHKMRNQDLTQKPDDEFGQLQIGQQTREDFTQHEQKPHSQKIYEQDMTQHTDDEFGQLQIGGQQKIIEPIQVQTPYNHKMHNQDLTQKTDDEFGQLQIGEQTRENFTQHEQKPHNQKIYEQDMTQHTDDEFEQLQIGGQQKIIEPIQVQTPYNHKMRNQDLTQKTDDEFGQLQIGQQTREDFTQHEQKPHNKNIYDHDVTQHTENEFGQLQIGAEHKTLDEVQKPHNQKLDKYDFTHRTDDEYGQSQNRQDQISQFPQYIPQHGDLTQIPEDEVEQLQVGEQKTTGFFHHNQKPYTQRTHYDQKLTQKVEHEFENQDHISQSPHGKKNDYDYTPQTDDKYEDRMPGQQQHIRSHHTVYYTGSPKLPNYSLNSAKDDDVFASQFHHTEISHAPKIHDANSRLMQKLSEKINQQRQEELHQKHELIEILNQNAQKPKGMTIHYSKYEPEVHTTVYRNYVLEPQTHKYVTDDTSIPQTHYQQSYSTGQRRSSSSHSSSSSSQKYGHSYSSSPSSYHTSYSS